MSQYFSLSTHLEAEKVRKSGVICDFKDEWGGLVARFCTLSAGPVQDHRNAYMDHVMKRVAKVKKKEDLKSEHWVLINAATLKQALQEILHWEIEVVDDLMPIVEEHEIPFREEDGRIIATFDGNQSQEACRAYFFAVVSRAQSLVSTILELTDKIDQAPDEELAAQGKNSRVGLPEMPE